MADITMCQDKECNLKLKCYRYTAKPNPSYQSYFADKVKIDRNVCEYFINNSNT